ncbi:MAG: hypothetical protein M1829_006885 [Trizodia sp. TS-e1964]|nr:MAG: hypothetical protein M1829_006885 [Trizodia sp. TS-e1964]
MEHPETGKLWCLPDKISCKCSLASNEVGQPGAAEAIDDTGQFNMLKDLNSPSGAISTIKVQAQEKEGPGTYILAREAMLAALSQPDRLWKKVSRRTWSFNRKTVDDSVWRDDMRGLVKELLRERVVHELIYLSTRRRGYVSGSTDTMEEILVRKQVGAILWMGSGSASHESAGAEKLEKRPVEFSSFVYGCSERRPVPVYNLQRLIGEEWVERLIALPGKEYSRSVAVLRSRRGTVAAQMALWRLEGYLAKYA